MIAIEASRNQSLRVAPSALNLSSTCTYHSVGDCWSQCVLILIQLWVGETLRGMKKLLKVLLVLLGIAAVAYIISQKQVETRQLWDEVLGKVPTPDCCEECCSAAEPVAS